MGQDHEERIKDLETEHVILKTEKKWVKMIFGAVGGVIVMLLKYLVNLVF
jgi:site-specific recombinase